MVEKTCLLLNKFGARFNEFYKKYIDCNRFPSKISLILLILLMGFIIWQLNRPTPWVVDDLLKSNALPNMKSTRDWYDHGYRFYMNWGGRVWGEMFSMAFLAIPKKVFNVVNTIGYLVFVYLVCVNIIGKWRIVPSVFVFVNFALFVCLPAFGQDILWICGTGNYMWAAIIPMLFLSFWRMYTEERKDYYQNTIFQIFILMAGIMTGWANENVSIGILAMLLVYTVIYRLHEDKCPIFAIVGFCGTVLGTALLWLAPGNFARFAAEHHTTFFIKIFIRIFKNVGQLFHFETGLLLIVTIILLLVFSQSQRKFIAINYLIGTVISAMAMGLVGSLHSRVFFGCIVLLIIAAGILYNDWSDTLKIRITKCFLSILMVLALTSMYSDARRGILSYARQWDSNLKIISYEKAKGNLDVYVNPIAPENKFVATYMLDDIQPQENNTHWLNLGVAHHFGLKTIQTVRVYENK